jgi:hypothetical protein
LYSLTPAVKQTDSFHCDGDDTGVMLLGPYYNRTGEHITLVWG